MRPYYVMDISTMRNFMPFDVEFPKLLIFLLGKSQNAMEDSEWKRYKTTKSRLIRFSILHRVAAKQESSYTRSKDKHSYLARVILLA